MATAEEILDAVREQAIDLANRPAVETQQGSVRTRYRELSPAMLEFLLASSAASSHAGFVYVTRSENG